MRDESHLFPYQRKAINHQCTHPQSMLWLDMGLGKTPITLTSIKYLLDVRYLRAVIIVAPIRVCRLVWRQEAKKWSHLQNLTFSMITGTRDQRSRALMQKADIYLVNYENLKWLAEALDTYYISKKLPIPFDGIVYDEVTKTKNSTTNRVKALEKVIPYFNWTTGLTGTPASNGYKDLHGQYLVVDGGLRLGTSKSAFKSRFYKKSGYKEIAYDNAEEQIKVLIGDITMEMSAADYNPLPDMVVNEVAVEMDPPIRAMYERLEQEYFTKLDNGTEIEVFNAASLTNKCLQFSNGAVYPVPGMPLWEPIHDLKLDALEEIIDEAQGQPILCSYAYVSDAERIMKRFHELRPINLTDCKSEKALNNAMMRWKTGDCRLMIGHPASMGHGIDGLQDNGHILVWYGLNWSLDLVDQFNARIRRQGQGAPVICHRILCKDTLDQAQALALDAKASTQASLRKAIKDYRIQKELLASSGQSILY
jgi:SNF2 family DNA or RNA helicase